MTQHFMIDIETLGNRPGAAILDIGVRHFDPKTRTPGDGRAILVKPAGDTDFSTIGWWMTQSEAARTRMAQAINRGSPEVVALNELSQFIHDRAPNRRDVRIWGNGATFDNVLLDAAYHRQGMGAPWGYAGHRCFRTLVGLSGRIDVARVGTHHTGLDDADYQVQVLFGAMDRLGLEDLG